jgi:hypothetical protein
MGGGAMGTLHVLCFFVYAVKILEYYNRQTQKFVIEVVAGPIYPFPLELTASMKSVIEHMSPVIWSNQRTWRSR